MSEARESALSANHGYDDQPASDCPCCKNWRGEVDWLIACIKDIGLGPTHLVWEKCTQAVARHEAGHPVESDAT